MFLKVSLGLSRLSFVKYRIYPNVKCNNDFVDVRYYKPAAPRLAINMQISRWRKMRSQIVGECITTRVFSWSRAPNLETERAVTGAL
jgi:hypothetical protein